MWYLLHKYPDAKTYKLVGNRGEVMQDSILHRSRGDKCEIIYIESKGKYLVSSFYELGYLPAAAAKLCEEQGEDSFNAYVAETGYDDDGIAMIKIYLLPKE